MKKIFLVSYEYHPIQYGGLARYAREFIDRLTRSSEYTAIIAVPCNNSLEFAQQIEPIKIRFFNKKYISYLEFSWKVFLGYVLKNKDHTFLFFSAFSYLFMPFRPRNFYLFITNTLKRVYIADYHGERKYKRILRKLTYFLLYKYEQILSRNAKLVFAISLSTAQDIENQYNIANEKIRIVPCALNTRLFPKIKHKKKFNHLLIYVGRLVPRKNILDLIEIMKLLKEQDKRFVLNVIGNGPRYYINQIDSRIRNYGLANNIRLHKDVTDDRLNQIYKSASIFVFTSLVEGFGLVLLEAMAKGLPVVAYDVNGVRDVVINGKNGFLIQPANYREFVNKILHLSKNNEIYHNFSREALLRITDFSWKKSANKIDRFLSKNH